MSALTTPTSAQGHEPLRQRPTTLNYQWPLMLPPADWYQDPYNSSMLRYWDGSNWTGYAAPRVAPDEKSATATDNDDTGTTPAVGVAMVRVTEGARFVGRLRSLVGRPAPAKQQVVEQSDNIPTLAEIVESFQREEPRHPLNEQVEVAGETFYPKGIRSVFREYGIPITSRGNTVDRVECILIPEPWNPHDVNAVAVIVSIHQVGHLPAELAKDYSPRLRRLGADATLATGMARIWAKLDSGVVRARVTLLIPQGPCKVG